MASELRTVSFRRLGFALESITLPMIEAARTHRISGSPLAFCLLLKYRDVSKGDDAFGMDCSCLACFNALLQHQCKGARDRAAIRSDSNLGRTDAFVRSCEKQQTNAMISQS